MRDITKKRVKAYLIDLAVSTTVSLVTESILEKKFKSPTYYNLVHPTLIQWSLEYAQLKRGGQTLGYRLTGLKLESTNGEQLTSSQVLKRMAYRDSIGAYSYFKNRERFEGEDGSQFPYEHAAGVKVREI